MALYGKRERYDVAQQLVKNANWTVNPDAGTISSRRFKSLKDMGTVRDGYNRVAVPCPDGKHRYVSAHRVIWEFVNGVSDLNLTINHKDGNTLNNCIDNLELVTNQDNIQHAHSILGRGNVSRNKGSVNPMAKLTEEQVSQIKAALEEGVPGRRIAEFFGVKDATLSNIKHGVVWRYVSPDYSWDVSIIPSELKPTSAVGRETQER